jgi:hypothetical protein
MLDGTKTVETVEEFALPAAHPAANKEHAQTWTKPRGVWRSALLVAFGHQLNRIVHSYIWQAGLVKEIL